MIKKINSGSIYRIIVLAETQVVISFKNAVREISSRMQENNSIVLSEVSQ